MKWAMSLRVGLLGVVAVLFAGCEHIEEPWTDYAPQYKEENFETTSPDAELRHRLQYTQTDR